jgi:hypothetical protein
LVSIGRSSFSHHFLIIFHSYQGILCGNFPPSPGVGWKMHRSGKSASAWKEPPTVGFNAGLQIKLKNYSWMADFMGNPKIKWMIWGKPYF